MKAKFIILMVSFLFAKPVHAWDDQDTAWQSIYLGLHVIDWAQTRDLATHCGSDPRPHENNGVLGRCPSPQTVDAYFLTTAIVHTGVAHLLRPRSRRMFQVITVSIQLVVVHENHQMGLKVNF